MSPTLCRRLGREVYEKLAELLMSGIYAGDGEQLSLAATFPQLRQLELNHGSLLKGCKALRHKPQVPIDLRLLIHPLHR
ncbi:MAG: hypothetical protein R2867_12410 [Caldilineaceae bacterium]